MTKAMASRPAATGLTRWQMRTVLVVLLSGQLLSALDQSIVGTALPTIVGQVGGLDGFSLVVTVYLLSSLVATSLYGKLADIYGVKRMYLFAIAVFTLGSALVGASQDMGQVVAFRAVQGIGAGGLVILAFTITSSVVSPRQVGRVQGLVGAMYALASLVGPLLGGLFTEYASWRWCFLVNVPIGAVALLVVATQLVLPSNRRQYSVDYWGAVTLTCGVSALVLAVVWGGDRYAWASPVVLALLGAVLVCVVLFVVCERRVTEPLVPLSLLRLPVISMAMLITFLVGVAIVGGYYYLPVYLQVVRNLSPTSSGLQLLPLMIAVMVGSGVSGWLIAAVFGRMKLIVVAGTGIMTLSLYLLSLLDATTPAWQLWVFEAVLGIGMGMVISKLIIAVQNSVSRRDIGIITAQAAFFRTIGSVIGSAAFGAVIAGRLGGGSLLFTDPQAIRALGSTDPVAYSRLVGTISDSLQTIFFAAVPIMVLAFVLTWFLPNHALRDGQSPWDGSDGGVEERQAPSSGQAPGPGGVRGR